MENEGGAISSLDQQAIPAFQRLWRSHHDEDYHDALSAQPESGGLSSFSTPIRSKLAFVSEPENACTMFEAELNEVLARSRYA
ncbi:hypothetical protein I6F21_36395 [Bradyrhizobium sp. NBAIM03]|uniref:hypothetical protein n=1 Tax=Bradyrhizobium sp. NBAIM03 TaxID=2793816 RepID=UPI001CD40CE2|nr:hypothetical protein [Bradyrhizobium sp. NBAIM03]MCA1537992.1 hypothetical protein [Bradyrhizobium sp. NBAIM03]